MPLNQAQERLCSDNKVDYSDLSAVLINTSLKKSSSESHTRLLLRRRRDHGQERHRREAGAHARPPKRR